MTPKSAIFLSATLTAFVVAVLLGVVTSIKNNSSQVAEAAPAATATVVQDTATATDQPTSAPAPTIQAALTYDEAAAIAAKSMNRQDVYSVEITSYQGADSFKVVFTTGDAVYVGLDRQVLATVPVTPTIANVTPIPQTVMQTSFQTPIKPARSSRRSGGSSQPSSGGGGESEPHDN